MLQLLKVKLTVHICVHPPLRKSETNPYRTNEIKTTAVVKMVPTNYSIHFTKIITAVESVFLCVLRPDIVLNKEL